MEREPFEDMSLIAEVAGREIEGGLTYFQEANLSLWDKFIDDIGEKNKLEREEIRKRRKESDEYQRRTIKEL